MFDAKKLLDMLVQSGSQAGSAASGLGGVLGQVGSVVGQALNQASSGVSQISSQVDQATQVSQRTGDLVRQTTGQSPADLVARAKGLVAKNPMVTGAALGGLAAVLLGTGGGRAVVGSVARMGGLALIGGLAYKAYQNYSAGKPLLDLGNAASDVAANPPQIADASQDDALRMVRVMIAAASADGVVDDSERAAILGNLKAAGLDDEAASFIDHEFANPADIATIAEGISDPNKAAQLYAAARLAIDPDTDDEKAFLAALAQGLSLDVGLVAHIDAAAQSAKA